MQQYLAFGHLNLPAVTRLSLTLPCPKVMSDIGSSVSAQNDPYDVH